MRRLRGCFKLGWPLVVALLITTVALAIFAGLAREVWEREAFGFDHAVLTWLDRVASPVLTQVALVITYSASHLLLIPAMLILALLWLKSHPGDWIALAVSLTGAAVINQAVKTLFERARPTLFPALMAETGYSFPSGHSQAALAFYGFLAYLVGRRAPPRWRAPVYVAAGAWVLLVGLSRNYLEVHFPSDVLAAFAITLPWILAVIFVHQCYAPPVAGENKVIEPPPVVADNPPN